MSHISELGATLASLSPTYLNRHHRGHQEKVAACPCATYSAYPTHVLSAAETRVFPHAKEEHTSLKSAHQPLRVCFSSRFFICRAGAPVSTILHKVAPFAKCLFLVL